MWLETERLVIRDLEAGDADVLADLWADSEVTRFMGGPRDRDRVRAIILEDAAVAEPPALDLWPVVEKATERVVGHCGLLQKEVDGRPEVELVYVLERAAWGQGYATEAALAVKDHAARALALSRLVSLIDPDNDASRRVAVRAGMALQGDTVRPGGKRLLVYAVDLPAGEAEEAR